jgi:hypothetical protein
MISESQQELQQLRQDAKTDGFSLDALNLLIQVRSRNLPDGGKRILNDLVAYATTSGIAFDQVSFQRVGDNIDKQHLGNALPERERTTPPRQPLLDHLRLPAQVALGALLSAAMLWYL